MKIFPRGGRKWKMAATIDRNVRGLFNKGEWRILHFPPHPHLFSVLLVL